MFFAFIHLGDFMVKLSKIYGADIYDDQGKHLGKAYDFIINVENGEIVRITTEPLTASLSKDTIEKILREKSILFRRVKSIGDIIVVSRS